MRKLYRSQVEDSVNLREDARNLLLFERAREWLLEDEVTDGAWVRGKDTKRHSRPQIALHPVSTRVKLVPSSEVL